MLLHALYDWYAALESVTVLRCPRNYCDIIIIINIKQ